MKGIHLGKCWFVLFVLLLNSIWQIQAVNDFAHNVFSAKHLRDLAFTYSEDKGEWIAKNPVLIIMYQPKCKPDYMEKYQMLPKYLPPPEVITYLTYDYETFPNGIWYKEDQNENLYEVFKVKRCPTAVFIKMGKPMTEFTSWYSTMDKSTFNNWFWDMMKTDIFVGSQYKHKVEVTFEGPGPALMAINFNNGEERNIIAYIGKTLIATVKGSGKDVVYTKLIAWDTPQDKHIIVLDSKSIGKLNMIKKKIITDSANKLTDVIETEKQLQMMYIRTYKQPLILGYITERGYTTMGMDDGPYDYIIDLISSETQKPKNKTIISEVDKSDYQPWVYTSTTNLQILPLQQSSKMYSHYLKKLVESWIGIDVELTKMEEIYFFAEGSYIRNHVTKATEAITAMAILEMESYDSVIAFQGVNYVTGQQEIIEITPGDVLLYESSTLVTSLYKPLTKGQYLTILCARFKPISEWPWADSKDNSKIGMDPNFFIHERMDLFNKKILTGQKPVPIDVDILKDLHKSKPRLEASLEVEEEVEEFFFQRSKKTSGVKDVLTKYESREQEFEQEENVNFKDEL